MPFNPADVLSALPVLSWAGLPSPPYDMLDVSWDNGLAERRIPYVDGAVHDAVGRGPFPLTARLYFLNTIGAGVLYPALWDRWRPALLTGEPNTLDHPALGSIRARVKGGKFVVRESCRSGIVVDVQWVETVEDPSQLNVNGYVNVELPSAAMAAAADAAMAPWVARDPSLGFAFGRPPQSLAVQYGITLGLPISISLVFSAIQPVLFSATSNAARLLAGVMGDVDVMIQRMPDSVFAYDATDKMVAFFLACDNMRKGMASTSRKVSTLVTPSQTTLDAIARSKGNDLKDIIGLNLSLIRSPLVPRGTAVRYYA